MTKEEFMTLQQELHESGRPLMSYLQDAGVNYSTYTYWRRKNYLFCGNHEAAQNMAVVCSLLAT